MAKSHITNQLGMFLAGALALMLPRGAQATMVSWGDPFVGHSWDATWSETSGASFNSFQARIFGPSSASFEIPGIYGLPDSINWLVGSLSSSGKEISASGPALQSLVFSTRFIGNADDYTPANQLFVDFQFKDNGAVVDEKYWSYDNVNGWVDPPPPSSVPEGGASLLLLSLSCLGMGTVRRVLK